MSPVSGCVFSGKGLCDDPIPRPEESYVQPRNKELIFIDFNINIVLFYFQMKLLPICCFRMYYI